MAMNIGFLVIGIILSTLSKWLQVQGNDELSILQRLVARTVQPSESPPIRTPRRRRNFIVPTVRLARLRSR